MGDYYDLKLKDLKDEERIKSLVEEKLALDEKVSGWKMIWK